MPAVLHVHVVLHVRASHIQKGRHLGEQGTLENQETHL